MASGAGLPWSALLNVEVPEVATPVAFPAHQKSRRAPTPVRSRMIHWHAATSGATPRVKTVHVLLVALAGGAVAEVLALKIHARTA